MVNQTPEGFAPRALDGDAPAGFVGRRAELDLLDRFLSESVAGKPRVVLVQGDPGVGKTRLVEEFLEMRAVRAAGARVLVGRCDADLQTPYLPVRVALGSLLAEEDGNKAASALGALLESGQAPEHTAGAGELYLAAAQYLIEASRARPLLLVIDDLHWADEPTVELLTYLATTLSTASRLEPVRVIVIATLRVAPRDHSARSLRRRLARIQREAITRTLSLDGLRSAEARALLAALGAAIPAGRPLSAVLEASRGNPLFLREVARAQAGQAAHEPLRAPRVPADLDDAIEGWFAELGPDVRGLLGVASVIGDRFSVDVLHEVARQSADGTRTTGKTRGSRGTGGSSTLDPERIQGLLEDAVAAGVLVEHEGRYGFVHPFVREKLASAGVPPALRERRHQWVASSLDVLSRGDDVDRASEISRHLLLAGPAADATLVDQVAEHAGDGAWATAAWAEADDCYELALGSGARERSSEERARLLSKSARAAIRRGSVERALARFGEARALCEAAGDADGAGLPLAREAAIHTEYAADRKALQAAADALQRQLAGSTPSPIVRSQMLQALAHAWRALGEPGRSLEAGLEAWQLAEQTHDATAGTLAADAIAITHLTRLEPAEALRWTEVSQAWAQPDVDSIYRAYPLSRLPLILWMEGRLAAATDAAESGQRAVLAANAGAVESVLLACRAGVAAARGEFDAAERLGRDALLLEEASSFRSGAHIACPVLAYTRAAAGDWTGARAALARWAPGADADTTAGYQLLLRLESGDQRGVVALQQDHAELTQRRWSASMLDLGHLAVAAEIAIPLGEADLRRYYLDTLAQVLDRGVVWPSGWPAFLPRLHGSIALALGELDLADTSLARAIALAEREGALPELAHSHLARARLLLARNAHTERPQLEEHLAEAIRAFGALGMTPHLDRAVAAAHELSAALPEVAAPAEPEPRPGGLTARQVEILRAISHGKTNPEIAEELVLSIATVKRHIANIYNRLDVPNRAAATSYAIQHGLGD